MESWQELNRLKGQIRDLERKLAKQIASVSSCPPVIPIKVGESSEVESETVYETIGQDVDGDREETYTNVHVLGGGAVKANTSAMMGIDRNGARYIFPQGDGFLWIQDLGNGTGKEVSIDQTGTITTPEGSETLDIQVAEPVSFFHNSVPPTALNRVYPGLKKLKSTGEEYFYLVSLPGHGDEASTIESAEVIFHDGDTIQVTARVDGSGALVSLTVTSV